MAGPTPPNITISPAAAQVAGCSASCTISGPTIDSSGNELYECSFAATAHGNYNFVRFTWRQSKIVYHKADGTTTDESFDVSTTNNPTNPADNSAYIGVTESVWTRTTWDVSSVTAYFEEIPTTYTITTAVSPVGGGTTTGDGTYSSGASCTITATQAAGYTFIRWEKNGAQVSTNASYTFTVSESATYTAVFEAATTATITIVARNGWGHVQFEGETPTTGTASKTVPIGTSVVMEAIESGTAHFSSWSGPGTGTTNKRLVRVVRTDETWTANFYYLCAAKVAQIADWTTPSPVGEVRAVDVDGATDWGNDVNRRINHGTQFSVEQRESLQGWHFVKWRYRTIGDWQETSEETLNFRYMTNLEAVALFKRTPTHLLVNCSDRTTPVQLVYDPATNKLVADY